MKYSISFFATMLSIFILIQLSSEEARMRSLNPLKQGVEEFSSKDDFE